MLEELAEATRKVAAQQNGCAALIDIQLDIWYARQQLDNPENCAKLGESHEAS
jgi:hypothetical protein